METVRDKGLAIANDLDKEDRELRKYVIQLASQFRTKGYNPKIRDASAVIEEKEYNIPELQALLASTNPQSHDTALS